MMKENRPLERILSRMGQYDLCMTSANERKASKPRGARRGMINEYAAPEVRWLEGVECPICGCGDLMDALGMGLCVSCNKFVRPKKRG